MKLERFLEDSQWQPLLMIKKPLDNQRQTQNLFKQLR